MQETGILGGRVLDVFLRGGILMWPILLCSIIALAFVIERLIGLRVSANFPRELFSRVRDLVRQGLTNEAIDLCKNNDTAFARLMHSCLVRAEAGGHEMEAALEETGGRVLYDLRRNVRPLGVIADIAPLLGLMGTVTGMIRCFDVVARAGALGRAELLAEGIAEALLTTLFGLAVAIPSLVFYYYFRGKADSLVRLMEDACIEILVELRMRKPTA